MRKFFNSSVILILAGLFPCLLFSTQGVADEGMYTFDNPPVKILKKKYGFSVTDKWLKSVMMSAVRFNSGGSGSFVSPEGLVMTNHHVGLDCIQKISTPEHDYVKEGFIAETMDEEVRCPDLELNVLVSLEDVTTQVTKVAKGVGNYAEAEKSRKKQIARIEKKCMEKTGLRCNVITLYGGGQYVLYRYRKHTDVRLVFAPEQQIAFFGGDPDNFTYPRYDMDVSFFRVYENGKPYHPEHYFRWSKNGAKEGELVFVVGNPGATGRMLTVSQLKFQRDIRTPNRLRSFRKMVKALKKYASASKENERQAKKLIFAYENAIKAYEGFAKGLGDEELFNKKIKQEEEFKKEVRKYPEIYKMVKDSWKNIEKAQEERAKIHLPRYAANAMVHRSELLRRATAIVQMIPEKKKPNEERLQEYTDSALPSLELDLFSSAPIYKGVERVVLLTSLKDAISVLGKDHPFVEAALGPYSSAEELVNSCVEKTKIYDVSYRKKLVKKGNKWRLRKWNRKIKKEKDEMIKLALRIDPVLRKLRKDYEEKIEGVEKSEGQKLALARFKIYGKNHPPDATFTLRLAFGVVKGYRAEGTIVPYKTNFYGLYSRWASFNGKHPFNLPERWIKNKDRLDMSTPLNFVSTADIVGGNSGSPVINSQGEIVGLIFDGNIESLVLRYFYTDEKARAVAVHSSGMREAIHKIYGCKRLIKELTHEN